MGREKMRVMDVQTHYGPRIPGGTSGDVLTAGTEREFLYEITGDILRDVQVGATDLNNTESSQFEGDFTTEAYIQVDEAFSTTGLVLNVGTAGSVGVNGVEVTSLDLATTGVKDLTGTLAGTWLPNTPLPDSITVKAIANATSIDDANVGKATLVVKWVRNR